MKVFKNGIITGLIIQFATGPVFFFIVNLSLQKTIYDGFAGVIAVTLVDYLYIALAIFGLNKLLEKKKIKKIFGILSSAILIIFGAIIIKNITDVSISTPLNTGSTDILSSFISVFFLTIFSPMTIVFWTGLFAAKAVEYNYSKRELLIFGLAVGLATPIFMGTSVVLFSLLKEAVPIILIQILNLMVGCLLILYGGIRITTVLKNRA
ncbi:MAG: LysE family transporter [Candidatus Gracilibacteria bacterium]|jgi:threonine/homoserine/homoserine lactone efflux protein